MRPISLPRALLALVAGVAIAQRAEAAAPGACGTPAFGAPLHFDIAGLGFPRAIAAADFNGDGRPDVVAAMYQTTSTVAVFLGDGAGGFGAPRTITLPGSVTGPVVVADFNGDGRPDVAIAQEGDPIWVLLGDGTGGLLPPAAVAIGSTASSLAAGDLDGDHRVDLVAAVGGSTIAVLFGNGAGGFGAPIALPAGMAGARSVAVADFNNDARPDVAVGGIAAAGGISGTVALLRGNGAGGFASPTTFPVSLAPRFVTAADLNHDGALDVVTANLNPTSNAGASVSVFIGDGAVGLGPETTYTEGGGLTGIISTDPVDLNGDGHLDLATLLVQNALGFSPGSLAVRLGDGAGGFGPPTSFGFGEVGGLATGDFDQDGRSDVVVVDRGPFRFPGVTLLLNMCGNVADVAVNLSDSPDPVLATQELTYTIDLVNNGPDRSGVKVSLNLSARRIEASRGRCEETRDNLFRPSITCELNLGTEAPDNRATIKVVLVSQSSLTLNVTVHANATVEDPVPANNTDSETTTVLFVGGNGFGLQEGTGTAPVLTWTAGDVQAGYFVARWVGGATTIFPASGVPLPANTTTFTDPAPVAGQLNCYVVAPVDASRRLYAYSKMLCAIPATASPPPSRPPSSFSVRYGDYLDASRVTLAWSGPGGQTAYVMAIYPLDGSPFRLALIDASAASIVDDTGGVPTCYVLAPLHGATPVGNSNALCAVPGVGTLGP